MKIDLNALTKFDASAVTYSAALLGFLLSIGAIGMIVFSTETGLTKGSAIGTTATAAVGSLVAGASFAKQKEKESLEIALERVVQKLHSGISTDWILKELEPFLSDSVKEEVVLLSQTLDGYLDRIHACDELSNYLGSENAKQLLFELACSATQKVLLEGSRENDDFQKDIYWYLRNWLKNSIRYEAALEDITPDPDLLNRSIQDDGLYADAFKFLRDIKIESFLNEDHSFSHSRTILTGVLHEHLTGLINKLKRSMV